MGGPDNKPRLLGYHNMGYQLEHGEEQYSDRVEEAVQVGEDGAVADVEGAVQVQEEAAVITDVEDDTGRMENSEERKKRTFILAPTTINPNQRDEEKIGNGTTQQAEITGVKELVQLHHGNDCWYKVYLIRDLGKVFNINSGKLIFVDGVDDLTSGPNEQQPNVFVTKKNVLGEEEGDEQVNVSLRIGQKIVFKDVSLSEALAGCIEMYFTFHLYYPEDADDLYQVAQWIICYYGKLLEGANNKKSTVKKCFRDFEVLFQKISYGHTKLSCVSRWVGWL